MEGRKEGRMSLSFRIDRNSTSKTNNSSSSTSTSQDRSRKLTRPSNQISLSDEDDDLLDSNPKSHNSKPSQIEFISDFDSNREPSNDLGTRSITIPALPDRDFRAIHLARKLRRAKKELYLPDQIDRHQRSSQATDLEGVDKINSQAIPGGLKPQTKSKPIEIEDSLETQVPSEQEHSNTIPTDPTSSITEPPTIEQLAVKELLSQANGDCQSKEIAKVEVIDMIHERKSSDLEDDDDEDESGDETAQFRKDLSRRPDCSSLEDYERIPVGHFGLALLKGMGWKEGTAATKKGRMGLIEAYVPQARPSLLGIGAKPLIMDSNPSASSNGQHKSKPVKPDKKYVPLLRKVIDRGDQPRSRSRSPSARYSSSAHDRPSASGGSSDRSSRREDDDYRRHSQDRESPKRSSSHHACDDDRRQYRHDDRQDRERSSRRRDYSDDDRDDDRDRDYSRSSSKSYRQSSSSHNHHHKTSSSDLREDHHRSRRETERERRINKYN